MVRAHAEMGPMYVSPVRIRSWMPHDVEVIGPEQIPVIQPSSWHDLPGRLCAFDKLRAVQNPEDALVHGYRADHVLEPIARRPSSFVNRFRNFAGLITPDFSVYRNMPRCERIYHTRVARGVGAYFQSRGLLIVPNVRWADRLDFDYCFLGLPVNAVVAISAHGCSRTSEDRHHFREGLNALLDVLEPKSVLVHGPMAPDVFGDVTSRARFIRYPSDIEAAHRKVT